MPRYLALPLAALILLIAGCSEAPVTGRQQIVLVSDEAATEMGQQAYREILSTQGVVENPEMTAAVQRVGRRLAEVSGQPDQDWQFNVIDDDLPTTRQLLRGYRASGGRVKRITLPRWMVSPLSGLCEWYHRWSQGQMPAILTRYKSDAQWKALKYSNEKAKQVLGWQPSIDFQAGLPETFASLRANAPATYRGFHANPVSQQHLSPAV